MSTNGFASDDNFITPEEYAAQKQQRIRGPNGWLLFAACNSGIHLADKIAREWEGLLKRKGSKFSEIERIGTTDKPLTKSFPDTETRCRLPIGVQGADVFVCQSVHDCRPGANTVNENLMHLLQLSHTVKSHGARRVTLVMPYLPYSRQNQPTFRKRELTIRCVADMMDVCGVDALVSYHPHSYSVYSAFGSRQRVIALSGLDMFLEAAKDYKGARDSTIVMSTDAGGTKFTAHFSRPLGLGFAIAVKDRDEERTRTVGIIGSVEGKQCALFSDDETLSAGTICDCVELVHTQYGLASEIMISHAKVRETGRGRLKKAVHSHGLKKIHVTDSIPQDPAFYDLEGVVVHPLARTLAMALNHHFYDTSVSELGYQPPDS